MLAKGLINIYGLIPLLGVIVLLLPLDARSAPGQPSRQLDSSQACSIKLVGSYYNDAWFESLSNKELSDRAKSLRAEVLDIDYSSRTSIVDSVKALNKMAQVICEGQLPYYIRAKYALNFAMACKSESALGGFCKRAIDAMSQSLDSRARNVLIIKYAGRYNQNHSALADVDVIFENHQSSLVAAAHQPATSKSVTDSVLNVSSSLVGEATVDKASTSYWWILLIGAVLAMVYLFYIVVRRKNAKQSRRAVVVDDDIFSLEYMKAVLKRYGYKVELYQDSKEAEVGLRDGQYDLLMVDFDMPEVNGEELMEKLDSDMLEMPKKKPKLWYYTSNPESIDNESAHFNNFVYQGVINKNQSSDGLIVKLDEWQLN